MNDTQFEESFNPCYNGKGIIAILGFRTSSPVQGCFNPCYNGKGIIAAQMIGFLGTPITVSILVIMERG